MNKFIRSLVLSKMFLLAVSLEGCRQVKEGCRQEADRKQAGGRQGAAIAGRVSQAGGTMGHFKESSYANLFLRNGTILTINHNYHHHTFKNNITHTIVAEKKHLHHFCLLSTMGKVSQLLQGIFFKLEPP